MIKTYQPSGGVGMLTIPLVAIASVTFCAVMYVYQLLLAWIPFIYVNFLLTIGAGMAGAYFVNWALKHGKCRNPIIAGAIALLMALLAISAKHWFQYESVLTELADNWQQILTDDGVAPEEIGVAPERGVLRQLLPFTEYIKSRVENGWEIGGGGPVSGAFVWIIWLIEGAIVTYSTISGGRKAASLPFNEELLLWADEEEVLGTVPISDEAEATRLAGAQSLEELLSAPTVASEETNHLLVYGLHSIPGEEMEEAFLTVKHLVLKVNQKGETEKEEHDLWKHVVISSEQRRQLAESLQHITAEFDPPTEADDGSAPEDETTDPA